jgi:membrane protease YdiL (CAAX protease family)
VSRSDHGGLSAFLALCLFLLVGALMVGLTFGFSALYAAVQDVSLGEASRHVRGHLPSLTLVQLLAMGTAVLAGLKIEDDDAVPAARLRLMPVRSGSLALCLLAGLSLQFPLSELANLLHHHVFGPEPLEEQLARQNLIEAHSLAAGAIVVVCLVALVPAAEELLFRGLFLFGLARRYGNGFALLLSSCLFGVLHFGAVPAVYAAVAGLLLGSVALVTGSIWPSIALHAAVNAVPVLLPESLLPIHGFNVPTEEPQHLPLWLVLPSLTLGICLLLLMRRLEAKASHE